MMKWLLFLVLSPLTIFSQVTVTSISNGVWSNPLTWDIGVPTIGNDVVINHSVVFDVVGKVNNLTVNVNTICDDTLYINGVLNLNANLTLIKPIVLVNDFVNKGRLGVTAPGVTLTGNIIWQKYIERCDGWGMYGGPFNKPLSDYGFIHTGFPGTAYPSFWVNTYFYDETVPDAHKDTGWTIPSNVGNILPRGKGVFIFDSSSSSTNNARVIELVGTTDLLENFDYNIQYSGIGFSGNNGWNLVSNPWLGTINWDDKGWFKKRIEGAIWVWDNCSNNYMTYSGGVAVNGGGPTISSGQAFWVKAVDVGATLRSKSRVIVDEQEEIKSSHVNDGLVRLTLNDDEIAFLINDSATNGHDTLYDAVKFICESSTLYTQIDSNIYSINHIKDKDTTSLYVRGSGTLEFDLTELSAVSTIYYIDRLTGVVYDASETPTYVFNSAGSEFYHRFDIVIPQLLYNNITHLPQPIINSVILHRYNVLGQLVNSNYEGTTIEVYADGTVKKTFKINTP